MSALPSGWATARIGDAITAEGIFADGDWVESKDQDPDGDVRLIQLADIGDGAFRDRSSRFLTSSRAAELGCTFLLPGDVLVARMPDPLGRACIFPGVGQPAVTAVDVCIVRPGPGGVDPRWLMSAVNAPRFRTWISELQSGTTRKRISRKNLATIEVPVPPLNEQRRIVVAMEEHFSRLDAGDGLLRAALRRISLLRKSVLVSVIPRPLPPQWEMLRVGDVGSVQLGRQRSPKYHRGPNMKPYLRVANVFEDRLDLSDVMQMDFSPDQIERYRLHPGDILLNEGQSPHLVGRPAMFRGELNDVCFTNSLIRFQPGPDVDGEFALLVFRSHLHSGRFQQEARITTNIAHMAAGRFKMVEFPVPPPEEQLALVAESKRRLSLIDALERDVEMATRRGKALRRSILERAFCGDLVPQDPADEPASDLLGRIASGRGPAVRKRRVPT